MRQLVNLVLLRFIDRQFHEEFVGDLEEIHEERVATRGKFLAETMYCFDAIHLLVGFSSTTQKQKNTNPLFMGNMFKIAWRNAIRQKQFTILNLLGLTLGIATCVGIGLYVFNETTYDTFHANGDRIYRVNQSMIWGDWTEQFAATGPGVGLAMREDINDFEVLTRLYSSGEQTIRVEIDNQPKLFSETKMGGADENFFKVFQFQFLSGDPTTALKDPNSIVINESTAQRYFGSNDALGKIIDVKNPESGIFAPYTIKGVIKDMPERCHLKLDVLYSLSTIEALKQRENTWIWTMFTNYVVVKEGTDIPVLTAKMQLLPPKWAPATTESVFNQSYQNFTKGKPWTLYLQPVRDIYLSATPIFNRFGPSGNRQFVYIFGAVGILVLVLSCINFMNLATAKSGNRAKEVGIRKVLGSQKGTLVRQFIVESTLYVAVATIAAFIIVQLSLGAFNTATDKKLDLLSHFSNPLFIGVIILFMITLGVLAGFYPAFYLSAFKPAETLKGKVRAGFKRKGLRNVLVVFQFTVSIVLIICTFFVQKQLSYTSSMNLGLTKEHVLEISHIEEVGDKIEVLKNKLQTNPAFTKVAISYQIPPYVWDGDKYRAEKSNPTAVDISYIRADEDYLPLLGVEFLLGRNFDPTNPNDKHKIILNEEAVRTLGWGTPDKWKTDSPIGKHVIQNFGKEDELEVIGVVRDFNFNSAKDKIRPLLVMHLNNDLHWSYGSGPRYLSLRLNPSSYETGSDLAEIIENVKQEVEKLAPSLIFEYTFLDDEFSQTFQSEQQMGVVLNLFTGLAVVIACLGLFGLAAFSAEQRLKELGIRRVMGAQVHEIVLLFSSEFTKLVLVAVVIAIPLAWFLTDYWLSDFAYRTSIEAWVFILASGCALAIAAITVSYQAFSAAHANPVDSLRNE
jgi:putative ABC transport system permease protein